MRIPSSLILGLLILLRPTPGAGQESSGAPPFSETLEVQVVNVDVQVTDKKGEPIIGLTEDEFILLIDGRSAPISNFYEVAEGRRLGTETAPATAPMSAPLTEPAATPDPFLVTLFLDNFQLRRADRTRILDDLESVAASLAGDEVSFLVASADPALRLRSRITQELDEVKIALGTVAESPAFGDEARRLWSSTLSSIQSTYESCESVPGCEPCLDAWGAMSGLWDSYAQSIMGRQSRAAAGLEDLFRVFDGIDGRKAVIYASSGIEQRPGIDLLQYLVQLCPSREFEFGASFMRHDDTKLLLDLGARASTSRATIYALHAAGLRNSFAASVEFADMFFRPSNIVDQLNLENVRGSMFVLAERTGGSAILNANAPAEALIRNMTRDFANYYSLGYRGDSQPDGKNHRIRVKIKDAKRGWQVRSRNAWLDKTLDERLVDRAIANMTLGTKANPLEVRASISEIVALGPDAVRVPVSIEISPDRLTLIEDAAGTRQGRFRVFLAAQAPNGDRTVLREKFFDVTPLALDAGVQRIVVNIDLEPGDYTIGVGVRDEIGTEASYLALETTAALAAEPSN